MFGTDVWMNGTHCGGDIACYTSQEYDVSRTVTPGSNLLSVRVGRREDLPPHSAAGNDLERSEWIPGIWGDVYLRECGNPRIRHVQVILCIDRLVAEVRVTLMNTLDSPRACEVVSQVHEKRSGEPVGVPVHVRKSVAAGSTMVCTIEHEIAGMRLWSVGDPFLYDVGIELHVEGKSSDSCDVTFGMREFRISGSDFYFNGKRIFLKGGNIAFHRFLSDADRRTLPWNPEWIKRVLVDIPKAHNMNFFRNHIGQMYNRWYDIADEHGMLLHGITLFEPSSRYLAS
jgi:beta-galactosidase/beta-glucuronidase